MMKVKVISPEGQIFSGDADAVTLPGEKGRFQVLHMHAPIVSTLAKGEVKIHCESGFSSAKKADSIADIEGKDLIINVTSGAVKSQNDQITILIN